MTKKKKPETDRAAINRLKKSMVGLHNKELQAMAPHLPGAMRIITYGFSVLDSAAKVKAPRGIKIKELKLTAANKELKLTAANPKAIADLVCANWILGIVKKFIKAEQGSNC
jgi:hypothetical protein